MIRRRTIANATGCASLALSLVFWLLLCFGIAKAHFAREHFMEGLNTLFHVWGMIWVLGLLLALVATGLGSRRWALATLLPVISFFVSAAILASVPF